MRQNGISAIFVLWVISAGFAAWMATLSIPHAVQLYLAGGILSAMAILLLAK